MTDFKKRLEVLRAKIVDFRYDALRKSNEYKDKAESKKAVKSVVNSVFPEGITCNYCAKELNKPSRSGLCDECYEKLRKNDGRICISCGRPFDSETDYCLGCQNNERYFEFCRSPLVYEGIAKELIHAFKFKNKRYLGKYFVGFMIDTYLDNPFNIDVVVPVPISKKRYIERGYNQSEILAKDFASRLNLDYDDSLLVKVKETKNQVGLGRRERIENLKDSFSASNEVKGKVVLLIDDVLTTASTVNECSRELLKKGAKSVEVITATSVEEKYYMA